jgi:transcriptional regulator with PAS, ATPase and Fis domain
MVTGEEEAISVMRESNPTATAQTASIAGLPRRTAELRREDLERLIPAKLSEVLLGVVARHPELMGEVVEAVSRALKTSPAPEPADDTVMVGSCAAMMAVFERIRRYSMVDVPVLLCGESGTGKELAAKAIHERSAFARGPFVAVNCGGLPESLVASELFGYERGAFTGATERRVGRIEAANAGTLFLDEIGDMPLSLQPQLLRFLQEMAFRRVGGKELIPVRLRIISATNVDLEQAVCEGRFRKDLYFRLNVLRMDLPALRERKGDIGVLVGYLLQRIADEHGCAPPTVSPSAMKMLKGHGWPGNIRELTSAIRRALIMCDGGELDERDFAFLREWHVDAPTGEKGISSAAAGNRSGKPSDGELLRVLSENKNNVTRTAQRFGVSRVTLYKWLKSTRY